MADDVVLCVARLMPPAEAVGQAMAAVVSEPFRRRRESCEVKEVVVVGREEEPLVGAAECRICHQGDSVYDMYTPCACTGSLKYVHKTCLRKWVNAKGDLTCEICRETYQNANYVLPHGYTDVNHVTSSVCWAVPHADLDFYDPSWRLSAEHHGHTTFNPSGIVYCCSAILTLMALLLIRLALLAYDGDGSEAAAETVSIFMARAAGLLLPYHALLWFFSFTLQWRRTQEEAAAAREAASSSLRRARP